MSYRVKWSSKSVSDLGEHTSFLERVSEEAARATASAIISAADSLAEFPERFPEFPMLSIFPVTIRKCVVDGRYVLLFGVYDGFVMIHRVLDVRKNFNGLLA